MFYTVNNQVDVACRLLQKNVTSENVLIVHRLSSSYYWRRGGGIVFIKGLLLLLMLKIRGVKMGLLGPKIILVLSSSSRFLFPTTGERFGQKIGDGFSNICSGSTHRENEDST